MSDKIEEEAAPFVKPFHETTGFWARLFHPRMLVSVAFYLLVLWLFTRLFDPITPFWLVVAFILGVASLPIGIMDRFRRVVDETEAGVDETEEDVAEAEEHEIRTSPSHGVPDDLSALDNLDTDSVADAGGLDDLSDLEDFDVLQEPDPQDDDD